MGRWHIVFFFLPKNCPYDHFSPADHSSFVVVVGLIPFSADDHTVTSRQCQKAQDPAGQTSSQLLHQIIHVAKPQPTVWRTAACRLLSGAYHHAVEPSQRTDTVLSVDIATVGCPVSIGCWHHNKINVPDTLASGSAHHSSSSFQAVSPREQTEAERDGTQAKKQTTRSGSHILEHNCISIMF